MKKGLHYLSRNEKKVVDPSVEELRNRLGNEIIKIVLFGSKIRGDFSEESDIDIFIPAKLRWYKRDQGHNECR